jgi:DNA primase
MPAQAASWLTQYNITIDDIKEREIMWCPSRQGLVFPLRDLRGNLFAWQMRCFDSGNKKWDSKGPVHAEAIWITKSMDDTFFQDTVILVEDIVSAIRVGHTCDCLPLLGSTLPLSVQNIALDYYKHIIIWMDRDALDKSLEYARRLQVLGGDKSTYVIHTNDDPKLYSDREIQEKISHALESV